MTTPEEEPYDWKAATFCLDLDDAAGLLQTTPQRVVDLMLTGQIGFYMKADPERTDGLPVDCARFDPDDLADFFRREHENFASIALPVLTNLRNYLREVPRTREYDTAVSAGRPMQTRAGLHVRVDAVVSFARRSSPSAAAKMEGSTEAAFKRLGLTRVRSLSPYGGKQRWGIWYRLPEVIAFEGRMVTIDTFLRHEGTTAKTERLIEAGDGSGLVVGQPLNGDDQ